MLMLKFGRLVDLEKLETVTVNRTLEELKEKLRQQESKSAAEIAKWNVSFPTGGKAVVLFAFFDTLGPC